MIFHMLLFNIAILYVLKVINSNDHKSLFNPIVHIAIDLSIDWDKLTIDLILLGDQSDKKYSVSHSKDHRIVQFYSII